MGMCGEGVGGGAGGGGQGIVMNYFVPCNCARGSVYKLLSPVVDSSLKPNANLTRNATSTYPVLRSKPVQQHWKSCAA